MRSSVLFLPSTLSGGPQTTGHFKMPSRTGFSIRRLISTRKPRELEDDDELFGGFGGMGQEEGPSLKSAKTASRANLKAPKGKGTKDPVIIIRRSEDIHRISHIPPLPGTPHSSKSSLCSCDLHNGDLTNPRPAPPRPGSSTPDTAPPLCGSAGSASSKESIMNQSQSSSSFRDDAPLSSGRPSSDNNEMDSHPERVEHPFEFDESLLLPSELEQEPIQPLAPLVASKPLPDTPQEDNVQQFSRETEEAFRLAIPLTEAQLSEFCARIDRAQALKSPTSPSLRRRSLRASQAGLKSPTTPTRPTSINKQKRQRSKKARRRARPIIKQATVWTENAKELKELLNYRIFHRIEVDEMLPPEKLQEIRLSRTGQTQSNRSTDTLKTTDTDTSDTPIEPFHMDDLPSRIGAAGVKFSPLVPTEVPTPRSHIFNKEEVAANGKASTSAEGENTATNEEEILPMQGTEPEPLLQELKPRDSFPSPPNKNPARFSTLNPKPLKPLVLPRRQLPSLPLPTIPEVITTPDMTPKTPSRSRPVSTVRSIKSVKRESVPELNPPLQTDEHIYLPCAPFSLTTPGIRNGRIRLIKADLTVGGQPAAGATMDDTLDWTAFQMAILGGAGDFFGEVTDYGRPSDEDLDVLDGLVTWFDDFGFDGPGALITGEYHDPMYWRDSTRPPASPEPSPRSVSRSKVANSSGRKRQPSRSDSRRGHSRSRSRMAVPTQAQANLAVSQEPERHQSGYLTGGPVMHPYHHQHSRSVNSIDKWSTADKQLQQMKQRAAKTHSLLTIDAALANTNQRGRYETRSQSTSDVRRQQSIDSVRSIDSLPQSPMMDLVISRDVDGNEYMVSMGYNLSHDLGDYLQWEAEHVSGAGFYS